MSVVTVAATLLVIEIVVQSVPLYPAEISTFDPEVGEVFVPGASGVQLNPGCWADYRQHVTINSRGLRDDELTYARTDRYRILVLGDSFVEARQVRLQDAFHVRLERLLDAEVIGAGHRGWGTDNELLWYRKEGRRYDPDLVLLLYQPGNDVQDNSTTINYEPGQAPYFTLEEGALVLHTEPPGDSLYTAERGILRGALHEFLLAHSRLYDIYVFRQRRANLAEGHYAVQYGAATDAPVEGSASAPTFDDLYAHASELTFALVGELRREVERDGAQFAAAIASANTQLVFGDDNEAVANQLTALGIPNVDLLPAIRAAHVPDTPMHFACDGHWTAAGHAVAAMTIADFLTTQLGVPGGS